MNDNKFNYKYVALNEEEKKEIESIRNMYIEKEKGETKIERLRRLNSLVKNVSTVWGLCFGIIGCLIFGLGLTMILEWNYLIWGVVISIVGVVPMIFAYPVYKKIFGKYKLKYGEEIITLSEELLNEKNG